MFTSPNPAHRPSAWILLAVAALLGGCAANKPLRTPDVSATVQEQLAKALAAPPAAVPARVSDALAEPAAAPVAPNEPRVDLLVNNAHAREVFLALVADSRYSMLMHPEVAGTLSLTLRGVTVPEALEAIRDVYGYDYRIEGRRVTVYAPSLQTRIYTVNYLNARRRGSSELSVTSGGASASAGSSSGAGAATSGTPGAGGAGGAEANLQRYQNSRVSTTSSTDLWQELGDAVRALIGNAEGRNVIASPQAGILAVRAMPDQLREVERFLKAAQVAISRQVMLEAKIVEVELSEGYQSGINWAALGTDGPNRTVGGGVLGSGVASNNPLFQSGAALPGAVPIPSVQAGGGLFGLALSTSRFAAVLGFLETQGDVQTLSSPRIATVNNQKAVLKVGSDDFYVTNVSGGSTTSTSAGSTPSITLPTLTLASFFSGIALDVTPQIDEGNTILLHIHPSVTNVVERTRTVDLGDIGSYRLPLASSAVNESDTLVRVQDGSIVAIGGLMQLESSRRDSGAPGSLGSAFASLLGNATRSGRKKELVVLVKPTIIRGAEDWERQTREARAALQELEAVRARIIRIDGSPASK